MGKRVFDGYALGPGVVRLSVRSQDALDHKILEEES